MANRVGDACSSSSPSRRARHRPTRLRSRHPAAVRHRQAPAASGCSVLRGVNSRRRLFGVGAASTGAASSRVSRSSLAAPADWLRARQATRGSPTSAISFARVSSESAPEGSGTTAWKRCVRSKSGASGSTSIRLLLEACRSCSTRGRYRLRLAPLTESASLVRRCRCSHAAHYNTAHRQRSRTRRRGVRAGSREKSFGGGSGGRLRRGVRLFLPGSRRLARPRLHCPWAGGSQVLTLEVEATRVRRCTLLGAG